MTYALPSPLQATLDAVLVGLQSFELPLRDENGTQVGIMRPVTARHLDDVEVVEKLTAWRNANMENFLTHFVATPERTRRWVKDVLLKARGQLLLLVYSEDLLVGHFGFKNLTADQALLDNAIRGERRGHPKLFVFAGRALVHWLLQTARVQRVDAYVMADNVPSMMMNRQIGFGGWSRHPLLKKTKDNEIHWEIGPTGQPSPDGRYCFKLWIRAGDA